MKATGIVRKVDELGRIVIPKELRKVMDIKIKDPLEIFTRDDQIILKKYSPTSECIICKKSNHGQYVMLNGKHVCSSCIEELHQELFQKR